MFQSDDAAQIKKRENKSIKFFENAMEDLVKVNDLLTIAVFIGFSVVNSKPLLPNDEGVRRCIADSHAPERLFVNEVVSFACYLLSSLAARALMMHLTIFYHPKKDLGNCAALAKWDASYNQVIRNGLLLLSTLGSIGGTIYLTQSMVDLVRILMGRIKCKAMDTMQAQTAGALIAINSLALAIYATFMMLSIWMPPRSLD